MATQPKTPQTKTAEHAGPPSSRRAVDHPALIVVFPKSCALPVPEPELGRQWLRDQGLEDREVSSRHCSFTWRPNNAVAITDRGSKHGTWVDGVRLLPQQERPLADGAVIRAGRTLMVFRAESAITAPSEPFGGIVAPFGLRQFAATLRLELARLKDLPVERQNVLITGETGTGKELLAKYVAQSLRPGKPYTAFNAAAMTKDLVESELFGHTKGAFTGATSKNAGLFVSSERGAVFLDEIGDMPVELQPKLLRFLQDRVVRPVGGSTKQQADVAVIAATNRDVHDRERFREDLLHRFDLRLSLPPLRERREDIFAVAGAILAADGYCLHDDAINVVAVERLMLHPWRGNVRDLRYALARIAARDNSGALRESVVASVLEEIDRAARLRAAPHEATDAQNRPPGIGPPNAGSAVVSPPSSGEESWRHSALGRHLDAMTDQAVLEAWEQHGSQRKLGIALAQRIGVDPGPNPTAVVGRRLGKISKK